MISPGSTAVPVPDVYDAPAGELTPGSVYIVMGPLGATMPQLLDGERTVLAVANGKKLELTTRASIVGLVDVEGTYLHPADAAALSPGTGATLRRYGWRDTLAKMMSAAGLLVLAPAALAVLTAVAGLYFGFAAAGDSGHSTAETAQAAVLWARQPADSSTAGAAGADVVAQLRSRLTQSSICLQQLSGEPATPAGIPGVNCATKSPPWYRSSTFGGLFTAAIALLTAGIGTVALNARFGFGKNPSS